MSDSVILGAMGILSAIIAALGMIQVALINTTRRHSKAIREQTENEHIENPHKISNMREDMDDKHAGIIGMLRHVLRNQNVQGQMITTLFAITTGQQDQIDEMTQESKEKKNETINPRT